MEVSGYLCTLTSAGASGHRISRNIYVPTPSPLHPPSKHPVLLGGAGTAMPRSSPLSMRLGIWSGWVEKHGRLRAARKSAACPNLLDEGEKKRRKESVDALDPEEYPVPCADGSPMSQPCCRRHSASPPQSYPGSCRATSTQAKVVIWAATQYDDKFYINTNTFDRYSGRQG